MTRFDQLLHLLAIETDECVLWPFATDPRGYGKLMLRGVVERTHILSCEHRHGPRPQGQFAAHSCDTPRCVNGSHLRWATPAENSRDMVERNRSVRGERHHCSRLTVADVLAIRSSTESRSVLAERYGVAPNTISQITHRVTWGWLSEDLAEVAA